MNVAFTERSRQPCTRTPRPVIVGPTDGKAGNLGSIGVRFMIDTEETHAGGFSLVEHPMPPRRLAAPLHRHTPRGRVLLRARGPHGRAARRRRRLRRGRRPRAQAAQPVAHVLERGRRALPHPRDHRPRRLRALLRRARRREPRRAARPRVAGRRSAPATAWSSTSRRSPACASASASPSASAICDRRRDLHERVRPRLRGRDQLARCADRSASPTRARRPASLPNATWRAISSRSRVSSSWTTYHASSSSSRTSAHGPSSTSR